MKNIHLSARAHASPEEGLCVMEYVSMLAGEPHSDRPACVSPVLRAFMIRWNDDLDNGTRQRLRPYAVRQIGTAGDGQDEARRYMALDWLVRTYAPAFLAAAGLAEEADKLRGLAAIESIEAAQAAEPKVHAARAAAGAAAWYAAGAAARDAVRDAAGAAAGDAVRAAAGAAAWYAAGDAVRDAAGAAAGDAVRAAAGDAARAALRPTVAALQESAFELLDGMIDPAGMHDVPLSEVELCERAGRKPLVRG